MKKHTSKTALLIYGSGNAGGRRLPLGRGDEAIYLRLESLGYQVTYRKHDEEDDAGLNSYTLIYISSLVGDSMFTTKFKADLHAASRPVIVADEKALSDLEMSATDGRHEEYPNDSPLLIDIVSNGHSLAAGMMDDAAVIGPANGDDAAAAGEGGAKTTVPVMWAVPAPSAVKVAALPRVARGHEARRRGEQSDTTQGSIRKFVVFGYERGARMSRGTIAASRRVAVFFNDETAARLTEDGWALFDASVNWAVGEELKQFSDVFREEWQEIRERRKRQGINRDDGTRESGGATSRAPRTQSTVSWKDKCARYDNPPENLVGLALSGGGIRSATFCLGLLQGLSRNGMLRIFDYVSTVSGGGYLGGWWSAWLARGGGGNLQGQPFYPFFNATDLKSPDEFIRRLLKEDDDLPAQKRVLYRYLRTTFHPDPLEKISRYDRQGGNLEGVKKFVVVELNKLIAHGGPPPAGCACEPGDIQTTEPCVPRCLFDPESKDESKQAFALALEATGAVPKNAKERRMCPSLSPETAAAVERARRGELDAEEMVLLNRRFLEEILRDELGINLFPGDERIEPVRSAIYFKDRVRRERRQDAAGALNETQRLIEERKYKEENAETAKELLCSGEDPIHHLRLFANYLTPRKGMLSADTWRAAAAVTRNLVMTWLTLVPILFAAVLAGQLYFSLRPAMPAVGAQGRTEESARRHYHNLSLLLVGDYDFPAESTFASGEEVAERYHTLGREVPVFHDFIFPYREVIGGLQRELRDTEAKLQAARTITNRVDREAASAEEQRLGEWKGQLAKRLSYTRDKYDESLSRRLWFALWPVGLMAGLMALLTCIWMTPSIGGMKRRNVICSLAVFFIAALAAAAAWPQLWSWMPDGRASSGGGLVDVIRPRHWLWLLAWLASAACICLWLRSKWKATAAGAAAAQVDAATSLNWRRTVLGTEVIRAHTLLLALAAAMTFVLALAGFGHDLVDYIIHSEDGWWTTLWRWAAVLSTALTFVAAVFTAVKGTPKGGGEKSVNDKPSLTSRLVFALTPPAVLLVLTLGVSWLAHKLLWAVACRGGESLGPLRLATLVGVTLCLCFSVIEIKWRRSAPFKWVRRWALVAVAAGAAFLYLAVEGTQPVALKDENPVEIVSATDDGIHPFSLTIRDPVNDWQWVESAWYAERGYLLLPMILALGLMLVRSIAKEMNDGKHGRLFAFAPLDYLLSRRASRPYLNRLELFGLALLLSAVVGTALFAAGGVAEFINNKITGAGAAWSGATKFPDLRARVVGEPMRVSMVGVCLTGIFLCWLLTLLELKRGTGNNRRALTVLSAALITLSALLLISFVPKYDDKSYALLGHASLVLLATSLGWVVALGWLADPNMLSMHLFYKSRLVRAYLGASNPQRQLRPREITESVEGDDVLLSDLKNCQRGAPYHLINTTLNLAAGRDLTTAQRSSAMFVLSKHNCGSSRTGYRRTENYMGGHLSLGTAVAASGAAASPSMGSRTPSSSLAMLMTILNVRLGYWAPTPNKEHWRQDQPQLWPFYLMREFLSQTNDLSSYSYLTDGGHFDNTGLYSLVERGCRYVVVADCGADPNPCFGDLGEAIRRCRIDFGAEINLNFEPFVKNDKKKSSAHFVVGTVYYRRDHLLRLGWRAEDAEKDDLRRGIIIVVKPSLVDDEPPDVRQYGIENSEFPQQSTADQWFDEAQFESYRRFGQDCIKKFFDRLPGLTRQQSGVTIDIKEKARDGSPLALADVEEVFDEAYERFRSREMRARKHGWMRKRLDASVRKILVEAKQEAHMEPTEGFQFYLDRLIDSGVSMLQEIENPARYIDDTEQNICRLVREVVEKAKEDGTDHLHEHYFFVARGARHIFPFAGSKENGHN